MNAIITGATKGIGKAIALRLATEGYNLAICSRNAVELSSLASLLEAKGVKVHYLPTDCADKASVYELCNFCSKVFGNIDLLINNAGVFIPGALLDEDDESFEQQLHVNLNSAYYLSKFIGQKMRSQGSGHIINICSVASKEIKENAGSYGVTKSALLSLNNVLRDELAKHNVKVTAVLPGSTLTASWDGTEVPKEKFVQPEDIAESISQLLKLSPAANVDELIIRPINF
jgi:3-oxoacyl-[acyl-carrier protein] reductase